MAAISLSMRDYSTETCSIIRSDSFAIEISVSSDTTSYIACDTHLAAYMRIALIFSRYTSERGQQLVRRSDLTLLIFIQTIGFGNPF
jgi:hypothetical protein